MLTFMEWHYYRDFLFKNFCLLVLFLVSFVLSLYLLVDKYFIIFSFILKTSASFYIWWKLSQKSTASQMQITADCGIQPQSLTLSYLFIKGSGNILEDEAERLSESKDQDIWCKIVFCIAESELYSQMLTTWPSI